MSNELPGWVPERRGNRIYVIAEVGVNHNGDLKQAMTLAQVAKEAGADCVKFQAFTAEELVTANGGKVEYQKKAGPQGESQQDMLRPLELHLDDFEALRDRCEDLRIDFLVTPFTASWVYALLGLGVIHWKVASTCLKSGLLLTAIIKSRLPTIISTGLSGAREVKDTLWRFQRQRYCDLAVLHCVSLYPTKLEQCNLRAIKTVEEITKCPAGFSDHTVETITGALAVAAGAQILEKHITLNKSLPGPDHKSSLEPSQLRAYIKLAREAGEAM